jgi:hypothetical protein
MDDVTYKYMTVTIGEPRFRAATKLTLTQEEPWRPESLPWSRSSCSAWLSPEDQLTGL